MEYAGAIWDPYLAKDRDALERVQQRAARWIAGDYSYKTSVTGIMSTLGLETLQERRKNARLTFMYKIIHNLVAVTMDEVKLVKADVRTRALHQHKLKQPKTNTVEYFHSFPINTIKEWNTLPASMAEAGTLNTFRCQLTPAAI